MGGPPRCQAAPGSPTRRREARPPPHRRLPRERMRPGFLLTPVLLRYTPASIFSKEGLMRVAVLSCLVLLAASIGRAQAPAVPGSPTFVSRCAGCHGTTG